jgi:hypothetical protein
LADKLVLNLRTSGNPNPNPSQMLGVFRGCQSEKALVGRQNRNLEVIIEFDSLSHHNLIHFIRDIIR